MSTMRAFLTENSVFIKTTAVGLAILVLIFCIPVKAHAVELTPILLPVGSPPTDSSTGQFIGYWRTTPVYATSPGPDIYVARILTGDPGIFVFTFSSEPITYNNTLDSIETLDGVYADGVYGYIYGWTDPDGLLPAFDTYQDAIDAVSSTPAETVSTLNYSLPPGNVAFVKLPDDVTLFEGVTLRTQMPETNLLYAPNGQLWNSSQRTGFSDSLPTADYDLSQFSLINWAKDGETTVLGLTENAIYSRGPLLIGNDYMVIVNPIYYGGTANGPYEFMLNGAVQINAVGVKGISVYALDSSIGFTSQGGLTVPTEVIGDPFGGEIDSETGEITWTDPSGGTNAPTEGGNNLIPTGETVFDAVKKIASDFADFLKGPISAIRTVVSAITNFLTEFKSLYIWLPGPVYNLITSAIMVALTIGVVKIFV